jgi:hypothetical protein
MVHIGVDDLKRQIAGDGGDHGVAEADHETPLTAEVARRIGCDARLLGCVDDADGNPLRLGRTKRVVSRALRRALLRRDRGCRFPGCTHSRWLHAHHMIHWLDEGRTEIENLVMLCSKHHRAVHEHGWEIVMTEVGFDAVPPDPTRVIVAPVGRVDEVDGAADVMPEPGWHGQRWDLATCVEVLLWTEERYQRAGPMAAAA